MLTLNIISSDLKKEIKLKNIFKSLKKIVYITILFVIIYSIVLLIADFTLGNHYEIIAIKSAKSDSEQNKTIENISEINSKIEETSKIQKEFINWVSLIEEISNSTKQDIKFSKISFSKEDGLSLIGNSKSREALLSLKKYLDEAKFLKDVDFPIENLLKKEDINFKIGAKFNSYEFK